MFVIRARFVQPDGVGYLTQCLHVSRDAGDAQVFEIEADAWERAYLSGLQGYDAQGPFLWVEPIFLTLPDSPIQG